MKLIQTINTAARLINRASERAGAGLEEEALDLMLELRDHLNEPIILPAVQETMTEDEKKELLG